MPKTPKPRWLICSAIVVLTIYTFYFLKSNDGLLHVYFLSVGQGDAIFIKTPSGNQILVDGGPDNSVVQELGKVMPFWDRSIDVLVMTHSDADHLNGLPEVLERYKVSQVVETGIECISAQCEKWKRLIEEEGAGRRIVWLGKKIDVGDGVMFEVLSPFENEEGESVNKKNNSSVVLKMIYGEQELLLTGDIEEMVERKLALAGVDIDVDFLKVAHHGSKTSTSEIFLNASTPKLAFINVGIKNRYGHPTEEVLNRLSNHGIKYYRTDTNGTIELMLDGSNYRVKYGKLN